jgi:hypothetical protein
MDNMAWTRPHALKSAADKQELDENADIVSNSLQENIVTTKAF